MKPKCGGGYLDAMIVLYLYSPESNSIDILRSPITGFGTGQAISLVCLMGDPQAAIRKSRREES